MQRRPGPLKPPPRPKTWLETKLAEGKPKAKATATSTAKVADGGKARGGNDHALLKHQRSKRRRIELGIAVFLVGAAGAFAMTFLVDALERDEEVEKPFDPDHPYAQHFADGGAGSLGAGGSAPY